MSVETITFLMLFSVLVVMILNFPIGLALAGVATIFGLIFVGPSVIDIFVLRLIGTFSDYTLLAVPLFVFMGIMIEKTGIGLRLFDATHVLFGKVRGGLAIATVITCTIFAAATGIVGASVVMMGVIALPAMLKYKYDPGLASGAICAGGTLGILIPPSIMILIYGPTAGISVGVLFSAAILPGILLSVLFIIYIIVKCYLNPEAGPAHTVNVPYREKIAHLVKSIFPVAGLILAVLGTIFFGLASPTEAAAIGAFFSGILAIAYKKLNFKVLKDVIYNTLKTTSMVYVVLIGAGFFTAVFMRLGGANTVRDLILGLPFGELGTLIIMLLTVVVLGMFVDWMGIVMIIVPIFTPIAAIFGWNPIWFAMMVMIVLQTSFLTPPFAGSIFYLKGVSPPDIKSLQIIRGIIPFILLQVIGTILCYIFPDIILILPRLFKLL